MRPWEKEENNVSKLDSIDNFHASILDSIFDSMILQSWPAVVRLGGVAACAESELATEVMGGEFETAVDVIQHVTGLLIDVIGSDVE